MAQKYKIIESQTHEIYERGETIVFDIEIRAFPSGTLTNCTNVNVTVTNPCDNEILSAQSMASDATGEYFYNYDIAADARYGEYEILYTAVDADGVTTRETTSYIIFPNDIVNKIRAYSGVSLASVSNETIARIGIEALRECLDDVFVLHKNEKAIYDPDYGTLFNGTNTVVRLACTPIADHDFDGNVYGSAQITDCDDWVDVSGYWYDEDYTRHCALVTVNDCVSGRITVTQADGVTAIPNTHNGVYFKYWHEWRTFNEKILKDAIAYLAAHHLVLRMTDLHHATAADLPSNQRKIELNLKRFKDKYDELFELISEPRIAGI
jgi:hypothetical protein